MNESRQAPEPEVGVHRRSRHQLRILFVGINYAPELTGIAPYTAAMARGLTRLGHDVRVLTAMPHYPEWRRHPRYGGWRRSEVIDGVRVDRVMHRLPRRPVGVGRLVSEVTFGLRVLFSPWHRPDVVVFVSPALFATRLAMLRTRFGRLRRRTAVWVQDLYSRGIVETAGIDPEAPAARFISAIESAVLTRSAAVVLIHRGFIECAERLGAHPKQLHIVRNWTHLEHASAEAAGDDRTAVRQRLGWTDHEVIALHSGNMGVKQALDNVIDAARLADERHAPVRFVFTGTGSERARLEEHARRIGTTRVHFMGPVASRDFSATLDAADVLLLNEAAGLREMAVPSKLTSYFSAGRPVVAATDRASLSAQEVESSAAGVRRSRRPAAVLAEVERTAAADWRRSAECPRSCRSSFSADGQERGGHQTACRLAYRNRVADRRRRVPAYRVPRRGRAADRA